MRYLKRALATILVAATATLVLPPMATAADWTTPGTMCVPGTGNIDYSIPEVSAIGGTAVVFCPLIKQNPANNITTIWARVEPTATASVNCIVQSHNSLGGSIDNGANAIESGAGARTVNMPLPDSFGSGGYAALNCSLGSGASVIGIRLVQTP